MGRVVYQKSVSRRNRARTLMELRRAGSLSRTALASRLGLSTTALTRIANDLLDAGIVRQEPVSDFRPDQPRALLRPNPDWGHIVTISMAYNLSIGVVDLVGALVHCERLAGNDLTGGHYVHTFEELLVPAVTRLLGAWSERRLLGIGVLSIGHVDREGVIRRNSQLPRDEVDMRQVLAPVTDLPVHTEEEVRLLLKTQFWHEAPKHWRTVVGLNPRAMGTKGGHALLVDGEFVCGRDGLAGLLGERVPVPFGGPAGDRMMEQVEKWGGTPVYLERVRKGDPEVMEVYRMTVANIAYRVADVLDTHNPDAVLLYGPYVDLGDPFLRDVIQAARPYADPVCLAGADLQFGGRRNDEAHLVAAAVPVLARIFVDGELDDMPGEIRMPAGVSASNR